jgi:MraZ protein
VPDYLKEFAGLKDKVIVAGLYKRLEVWDQQAWEEHKKMTDKQMDTMAEKLGELGVY